MKSFSNVLTMRSRWLCVLGSGAIACTHCTGFAYLPRCVMTQGPHPHDRPISAG